MRNGLPIAKNSSDSGIAAARAGSEGASFHEIEIDRKMSGVSRSTICAFVASALVAMVLFVGEAGAAITFNANSSDPNDLDVVVTAPIEIPLTVRNPTDSVVLAIQGVYSLSPGHNVKPPSSNSAALTYSGTGTSTLRAVIGGTTTDFGAVTGVDLYLEWQFGVSFDPGETLTVGVGVFTIDDFLVAGSVPDLPARTAIVVEGFLFSAISDPVSVPEPSSAFLFGLGLLGLVGRRRRPVLGSRPWRRSPGLG